MPQSTYRSYFNIDPDYLSQINKHAIDTYPDLWKKFYPHPTFVKLIKDTVSVLSRQQKLSVWVEGSYGTGKSHAVLTLKKLIEANEEDTKAYFDDNHLDRDLYLKLQREKSNGKILTVHRYGSSSIKGDDDLVLAIQESIEKALTDNNIENKANITLKNSVIRFLSDSENKQSFNIYAKGSYNSLLGGDDADTIVEKLKTYTDDALSTLMEKIFRVAQFKRNFKTSTTELCEWIREVIEKNNLKAILFIWDEFSEYFDNNMRTLTGFQEIADISGSANFYLMIVTHKSGALFNEGDRDKTKTLDRFVSPTCHISLPENIAFDLMGKAMRTITDETLKAEWNRHNSSLAMRTSRSRKAVRDNTSIADEALLKILPIHPYAALLLKHISAAFESNQRSMFDFIKNDTGNTIKGFQWFIDNYGFYGGNYVDADGKAVNTQNPLLTIDMLWDFFYEKGENRLSPNILMLLNNYRRLAEGLYDDEKRVLKTILLLQSISQNVDGNVDLFIPNTKNIELAFEGSDLENSALRCAAKLLRDHVISRKPATGENFQYTVIQNGVWEIDLTPFIRQAKEKTTKDMLDTEDSELRETVELNGALGKRYEVRYASLDNLDNEISKLNNPAVETNKIPAIVTVAMTDSEAATIAKKIEEAFKITPDSPIVFIDTSVTPLGADAHKQYVENIAQALAIGNSNHDDRRAYTGYACDVLKKWAKRIREGEFIVCTKDVPRGNRINNIDELKDELLVIDRDIYTQCLEGEFKNVINTMYDSNSLKAGALCAIKQQTSGTFRSANPNSKLENALENAWGVEKYWEVTPHLYISRLKISVDNAIQRAFDKNDRVSIAAIYDMLKAAPYGFMPVNLTAFVLGFILKEYADGSFSYSDTLTTEPLTEDKLALMIDEIIKQNNTPNPRYKDKYIVTLTEEEKAFNKATSVSFNISESYCTSITDTRERIRAEMKKLSFPMWVLKYVLAGNQFKTNEETVAELIDLFCGIANNRNMAGNMSDSDIALRIGKLCIEYPDASEDLKSILSKDNCTVGMTAYLENYNNRTLPNLAAQVDDNGQYINVLRKKFDADAANWVWNVDTANNKIEETIIEYRIIVESNKILSKSVTFAETIRSWCDKIGQIRVSYLMAKNHLGAIEPFLKMLYDLKRAGNLLDSQKTGFLDQLTNNIEEFRLFMNSQVELLKKMCPFDVEDLYDEEIKEMMEGDDTFRGSFTKEKNEYSAIVTKAVEKYKSELGHTKLKTLWKDNTYTDTPRVWSNTYHMPVLAMVPEDDVAEARKAFDTINRANPDAASVDQALAYLERATIFEALNSHEARDTAFKELIIKNYAVMLTNIDAVKTYLNSHATTEPYYWLGSTEIESKLKQMSEANYNRIGYVQAEEVIDGMDSDEVKRYLKDLIRDNMIVGMEIIKNK